MSIISLFIKITKILYLNKLYIFCFYAGTNVSAGKELLEESGLPIEFASNLDDAAKKAISSLKK